MQSQELLTVINSKGEIKKLRRHFVESPFNSGWQIIEEPGFNYTIPVLLRLTTDYTYTEAIALVRSISSESEMRKAIKGEDRKKVLEAVASRMRQISTKSK